jgi:ABC-type glucose/galactose transport system permease subunit
VKRRGGENHVTHKSSAVSIPDELLELLIEYHILIVIVINEVISLSANDAIAGLDVHPALSSIRKLGLSQHFGVSTGR